MQNYNWLILNRNQKWKLRNLLGELKKFKVQTILVLEFKKMDDHKVIYKIFLFITNLNVNDSDIDKAFRSMHQSIITKIKKFSLLIVKTIVEHNIKLCEC